MNKPTVVILAGGANSRFFPFNTGTHKGALQLFGEKLIVRTLRDLEAHGYDDIIIVVSPRDYDGQGLSSVIDPIQFTSRVSFVLQPEAKGMGDAVLQAKDYLSDRFAVVAPNNLNAGELLDKMLALGEGNVICTSHTDEPWLYGIVTMENGRATGIVEKPPKGQEKSQDRIEIVYLLDQAYLQRLQEIPTEEYNFETALNDIMSRSAVPVFQLDQPLPTLKYPWHLFEYQQQLFDGLQSFVSPDASVAPTAILDESQGPIFIEAGAVVGHAARIVGPSYIGQNALVGDFSFVRQSSLEADVQVGANTEVVRSIIMRGTTLHYGYLADSILGEDVRIGAGLITANKRFDRDHIKVLVKDELVSVNRENLGVLVGNDANIGIRVSTMPGIFIGARAQVFPGQIVYRNVNHDQIVKG